MKAYTFALGIIFAAFLSSCNPNNSKQAHNENVNAEKRAVDSIYVKYETSIINNSNFQLVITDPKMEVQEIKPDTNFIAYSYTGQSSFERFDIPFGTLFPIQTGDSIIVEVKDGYPHLQVANSSFNDQEINFGTELLKRRTPIFEAVAITDSASLEKYIKQSNHYIDSSYKVGAVSGQFENWIKKEMEYAQLYAQQNKKIFNGTRNISSNINIDENLNLSKYRSFVYRIMANELKEDLSISSVLNSANTLFTGKTKDYVLYSFAKESLANMDATKANQALKELKGKFNDSTYYSLLTDRFEPTFKDSVKQSNVLINQKGDKFTLNDILSQHKGKKVYVDFWASWCAPCRAEMPSSKKLEKSFPNVVFLYLSLDKVQKDWLEAMKFEGLKESNSFLFANIETDDFLAEHKVNMIPRYMIFDKEGVLINKDAPRPSNQKIAGLLKD